MRKRNDYYDAFPTDLDTSEGLDITDPDAFEDDFNPSLWVPDRSFSIYNND